MSVDHPTFLEDGIFVLGVYHKVSDGIASFKVHFNAMFPADVLATLTHFFHIRHHYACLVAIEACVVAAVIWNFCWFCWSSSVLCLPHLKPILEYLHFLSDSWR